MAVGPVPHSRPAAAGRPLTSTPDAWPGCTWAGRTVPHRSPAPPPAQRPEEPAVPGGGGADGPGPASAALGAASGAKTGRTRSSLHCPTGDQVPSEQVCPLSRPGAVAAQTAPWVPQATCTRPGQLAFPTQDPSSLRTLPATGSRGQRGVGLRAPALNAAAASWAPACAEPWSAEGFPLRGPAALSLPTASAWHWAGCAFVIPTRMQTCRTGLAGGSASRAPATCTPALRL